MGVAVGTGGAVAAGRVGCVAGVSVGGKAAGAVAAGAACGDAGGKAVAGAESVGSVQAAAKMLNANAAHSKMMTTVARRFFAAAACGTGESR